MTLLTDDDYATGSLADLPSNEDVLTIIKGEISVTDLKGNSSDIKISNTHLIAQYMEKKWDWFMGFVKDKLSDNQ